MHYYQFNIGDYRRDTSHLSLLEHGIYRQLIDTYYLSEKPLCADYANLMRSHCVRTDEEEKALKNVLNDFFVLTDDGWLHKGCEKIIDSYRTKSEKAKVSANVRWAKNANAMRTHTECNANGMLTINHKPITNIKDKETTSLSDRSRDAPLRCPVEKLVDLYHKALPTCPQVAVMTKTRQAYAASRWREVCKADSWETQSEGLEFFESYFQKVAESKFLIGSADGRNGKVPFRADFEWLMRPNNFAKVLEGKYHR